MAADNEIVAAGEVLLAAERDRMLVEHYQAQSAFDKLVAARVASELDVRLVAMMDAVVGAVSALCAEVGSMRAAIDAPRVRTPIRDKSGAIIGVSETRGDD